MPSTIPQMDRLMGSQLQSLIPYVEQLITITMSTQSASPRSSLSNSSNSSSPTNASATSDQIARLDTLLEIYLERLDTYQQLRNELSKNFAAGFLSLAHANHTSSLGSGRRYGEEGYDLRMKAGRRVRIHTKADQDIVGLSRKDLDSHMQPAAESTLESTRWTIEPSGEYAGDPTDAVTTSTCTGMPTQDQDQTSGCPAASMDPKASNSTTSSGLPEPTTMSTSAPLSDQPRDQLPNGKLKPRKPLNPLNWYGVLIPASLRATQSSFTTAVQDQVPQILTVQAEMTRLEMQIRRLRTEAGLSQSNSYEADELTGDPSTVKVEAEQLRRCSRDGTRSDGMADPRDRRYESGTKTSTASLSSRPKEPPRSRILKLDD